MTPPKDFCLDPGPPAPTPTCPPSPVLSDALQICHPHAAGIDRGVLDSLVRAVGGPRRASPPHRSSASQACPRSPENRSARLQVAAAPARLWAARRGFPSRGSGVRAAQLLTPPPDVTHLCRPPYSAHAQGLATDEPQAHPGRQ